MKSPEKLFDARPSSLSKTPTLHEIMNLALISNGIEYPEEFDFRLESINAIASPLFGEIIHVDLAPGAYAFDLDDNPFQMTNGTYHGKFRGFTASSDTIRQETGAVCLSIDAIFPDGSTESETQLALKAVTFASSAQELYRQLGYSSLPRHDKAFKILTNIFSYAKSMRMRHPNASLKPEQLELIEKWNYAVAPESISISDARRIPLQVSADAADIIYSEARIESSHMKDLNEVKFGGFFLAITNGYLSVDVPSFVFEIYCIDDEDLTAEISRKSMQNPYAKSPILFVPIDVDIDFMIDRNEI